MSKKIFCHNLILASKKNYFNVNEILLDRNLNELMLMISQLK